MRRAVERVRRLTFGRRQNGVERKEALDLALLRSSKKWRVPSIGQLKFIGRLLEDHERRSLFISILIGIAALGVLGTRIWFRSTVAVPATGGSYTEGLVGSPRFINPLLAAGNDVDRDLSRLIFAGLLTTDADGNIVRDLAENYTISDDQKIYTVTLRRNLTWHDNEPLTADDVLFTIQAIQDPAYHSSLRVSFDGIDVKKQDDTTIIFTLRTPFPGFLSALTVGILPEHIWYSIPASQMQLAEANLKPVGAGPYRFKNLVRDTTGAIRSITLERNGAYHQTPAYIRELSFKFYGDYPSAVEALKNKNIEGLSFLPLEYSSDFENSSTVSLEELELTQYNALFFNPDKNDALKDRAVRKVLAAGVDRDRIIREILGGEGRAMYGPELPGFDSTSTSTPSFDVPALSKALDDAGWKLPTATSTVRMKDGKELTITISAVEGQDTEGVTQVIRENWTSLGIAVNVSLVPKTNIKKDVIEQRAYEMLLFGQIITSPQDVYAFWHSSQNRHPGSNFSVLANRDIDAAAEELRTTSDKNKQQQLYTTLSHKLSDEAFAVFLYSPQYLYVLPKKILGVTSHVRIAAPADRFSAVTHWYIKTNRAYKKSN
ncbi:MAG: hypothetical protein A3B30_01570 [Candidatus Komeilibacteria bacterium RIFCSPLOWO2_01_FULL_52_15]|uniref:Solute-binding protein family 5 domain-containing protein n=1 Tax=Candidatus Komeilibacteria bacterium RIFCSPLOWO2_01_FULL_52_15 TaxID=1798551 RepID=A0A1G2BRI7_9BACT|nr:MAG: hypothetical protein A3B30_01570 [Candidatus Komeilibacteria bacterium RIFCSPLOWO2_01_FULL_52_15]